MGKNKRAIKEYWSMTEGVFNCLIDEERTLAFKKAIKNTIKKGDVVVDVGTGSGILAMFAAKAGAKKVYAIEFDKKNIRTLKENFKINNLEDRIILLEGDARKIKLPEKVDVIIGELIATGLIEEQQIPAMNNLLNYAKDKTKVVLNSYETYIDLVNNKGDYYGFKMFNVRYEYTGIPGIESISFTDKASISKIDFFKNNKNVKVNKKIILKSHKKGKINALRISGKTFFYDGSIFNHSFAYSYPIILPMQEIRVEKNDEIIVEISYVPCGGFDSLKYKVLKSKK